MSDKQDYDWLEDPFNEEKNKKDLEDAKRSQNRGLLIVLVIVVIACLVLFGSCSVASNLFFS